MKKILAYLPSLVFFIILIAMSGLGTLIQFNFDIQQIVWATFIVGFSLRFLLNAMSRYIGADTCYNLERAKPYVQEPKERFVKLSRAIDYGTFEDWIDGENLLTKIRIYKERKIKKINRIKRSIRKFTTKNRLKHKNKYDIIINKLNERKAFLESEITEECINENISYLRIRFRRLKAKDFETESEVANTVKKTYSINAPFETVKGITKGLPLMFFVSLFGSMLTYNITMGSINAMSCLYDIAMIIFNATSGYVALGKKNIQRLIGVYNDRSEVLSKYINQAPPVSRAFKLLEALKDKPIEKENPS